MAEKQQESGFFFLNKYGERITTRGISGQLKKLAVRYDINPAVVYPHSFRHRFAKSFLEHCNDIAFLADLMGHLKRHFIVDTTLNSVQLLIMRIIGDTKIR